MTRWYPLESADGDFFASAPHVFRYQKRFTAPVAQVWESLTSDVSLAAWTRLVKEVRWTSARPFGVGTTREVAAPALLALRERFFRWDEGSGYSFYVYESTRRLFTRFAEDYIFEPDGEDTLFTWTLALEPKPRLTLPFKVLAPALKAAYGRIPADGQRYFAKRV